LLILPGRFLNNLGTLGSNATLKLVVDESDPLRAGVAKNAVQGVLDDFIKGVVGEKIRGVEGLLNLTVNGGSTVVLGAQVDILGIQAARERLNEVKADLPPNSPDVQRVQDVIAFLDFAGGVLGNSERYLTTTALPLRVDRWAPASRATRVPSSPPPGPIGRGVFGRGARAAALR